MIVFVWSAVPHQELSSISSTVRMRISVALGVAVALLVGQASAQGECTS